MTMVSFRSESQRICRFLLCLFLAVSIDVQAQVVVDTSRDPGTVTANPQAADPGTQTPAGSTPAPGQTTTPPHLPAAGQNPPTPELPDQRLEVYGYVMTDFGYNFQT